MELKIPTGPSGIEPALLSYSQACEVLNCRPTKLRELLPRLDVRMVGRRPMITVASIRSYLRSLPRVSPVKAGKGEASAP